MRSWHGIALSYPRQRPALRVFAGRDSRHRVAVHLQTSPRLLAFAFGVVSMSQDGARNPQGDRMQGERWGVAPYLRALTE